MHQPALRFEVGARAGKAACSSGEAQVTSRPASIVEVQARLQGNWTFCSGRLGTRYEGISFGPDSRYQFLDADGHAIPDAAGSVTILDTSEANGPKSFQVNLRQDNTGWIMSLPMFSQAPLKIWASDPFRTVLSAE